MIVKFWGVHGSIPRPGRKTLKYGGNTPCVEVRCQDTLLILDAGTGIRELGEDLLRRHTDESGRRAGIQAHILISHLHWDHVHGLPFFEPGFIEGNQFHVYGVRSVACCIRSTIDRQMAEPNFPIAIEDLEATFEFHDLSPGDTRIIDGVTLRVVELNHPGGCLGYSIQSGGRSLVYASDTQQVESDNKPLLEIARAADLLIFDSMFSPEQYYGMVDGIKRSSWGHSTWEAAVRIAVDARVKRLVLFHHGNEDSVVEEIEKKAQERFPNTTAAYEGLEIEL